MSRVSFPPTPAFTTGSPAIRVMGHAFAYEAPKITITPASPLAETCGVGAWAFAKTLAVASTRHVMRESIFMFADVPYPENDARALYKMDFCPATRGFERE
jgi:hypothetical protein